MEIKNKSTLAEKQAYWAEQLPNFESKYWLPSHFEFLAFDMDQGNYTIKNDLDPSFEDDATEIWHRVNTGWAMWKKAINFSKPHEGFVLVPESKISHFWQDNDEPENLCIDASGFNSLGDCIDDGEVMIVSKFTQANISKQKMFGVWCTCEPKPFTRFIKEFKLFDTQEEAEQAMIEAQEQSHE